MDNLSSALIVVSNHKDWPISLSVGQVVTARAYLTDPSFSQQREARVFNLCRSYRYQSAGYYVSLLASARGHKPLPNIAAIQDMKSVAIVRLASDELEELIQKSLKPIESKTFTLSVYFGRNLAKRYDRLSLHLFKLFQAPFLRADFIHTEDGWLLRAIRPISIKEIPESHRDFLREVTEKFFNAKRFIAPKRWRPRYDIAILHDPEESEPPSNEKALDKFIKAAKRLNMRAELIEREDYGILPQYDALFIRETTKINHHTYRFARRAYAEGLIVVDDPESIEKCANKVFLAELLTRHGIPTPKTLIVHRGNRERVAETVGMPCILKKPDSSFSQGVFKAATQEELHSFIDQLLEESDLIIAQEYMPTDFDWRVGVFNRKPLYVCRYHMAKKHWQIIHKDSSGRTHYGKADALPLSEAPRVVVKTALRAANLIGDGLYGVDLKQTAHGVFVIEVNDNPNIDAGCEDAILKDNLYQEIMAIFLKRIERRKGILVSE